MADSEPFDLVLDEEHGRLLVEAVLLFEHKCGIDFEWHLLHQTDGAQHDHKNARDVIFVCVVPLKAPGKCLRFVPHHAQETEIEFQRYDQYIGDDGLKNGKLHLIQSINASLFECFQLDDVDQFDWNFLCFFVYLNLEIETKQNKYVES